MLLPWIFLRLAEFGVAHLFKFQPLGVLDHIVFGTNGMGNWAKQVKGRAELQIHHILTYPAAFELTESLYKLTLVDSH